jgi:dienelactone hydrolase
MMTVLAVVLALASSLQEPSPVARTQAAVDAIAAGAFEKVESQFTEGMKRVMPAGRLAAAWAALQARYGVFSSCTTNPGIRNEGAMHRVVSTCAFERAMVDVEFSFNPAGRIGGMGFPRMGLVSGTYTSPTYVDRASFVETSLTIGSGRWMLPAVLTRPVSAAPVPAVVLVHGSGPGDKDLGVGANRPFRDLAEGLASRGVAVLRYDKRTKVYGDNVADIPHYTVQHVVLDDVREAVRVLRAQPGIDPTRVVVLGLSLGGMLIPRIGLADPALAGLIVMAGPARPVEDALEAQSRYLATADGVITAEEQIGLEAMAAVAASLRTQTAGDAMSSRMIRGAPASYWFDLRAFDPPTTAIDVKMPMLILQGERDYHVTMAEFARWKSALGFRTDVTFTSYPALNHLFMAGTGPSLPTEYDVPGHVAEEVVRDIAAWVRRR